MSWKGLRHKGTEVLRSSEWNAAVDALDELHARLTSGEQDITVRDVNARTGNFSDNVYVQGRPVLKDGDPITVAEFGDVAKQQIREAVDESGAINSLLQEFVPVYTTIFTHASENTDGVQIVLDKGGRPHVNVYYSVGGTSELHVEVSTDGNQWRVLDSRTFITPSSGVLSYAGVVYPYLRVRVPTANIDVELEVVASR